MKTVSAVLAVSLLFPVNAWAAEPPPGASSCSGCHATNSAVATPVPPVQGRSASEIMEAMTEFRAGKMPATVMDRIAKGFTDDELQPIAAWLASQKPN